MLISHQNHQRSDHVRIVALVAVGHTHAREAVHEVTVAGIGLAVIHLVVEATHDPEVAQAVATDAVLVTNTTTDLVISITTIEEGIDLIIIEVSRTEIFVTIEIVGTTIGMAGTTTVVETVIGDHDQEATRDHAVHTIGAMTVQTINQNHHRHHLRRLHNQVIQFQH